jgi:anaerobic magnesium-protoporphyrin IX monomethyl ester cyclase
MRILFLNLPCDLQVTRRYMCSTQNEMYLFPPHDLLALAGIAQNSGHDVFFFDAVAEKANTGSCLQYMQSVKPEMLISIMSFEWFDKDVNEVKAIRKYFPELKVGLFGHYPTHFPKETIVLTDADFVLLGEPDNVFENFIKDTKNGKIPENVIGTAVKSVDGIILVNQEDRRVPNPNLLPMPPYDLLKAELYQEPFLKSPMGMIQSARGCPYMCNYCVHSFGTKLTALTPENVIEHILFLKKTFNIQSLRFIDDTFTAVPSRVIKICKLMIEHNLNLQWSCLSRADTLNEEMLQWMKKAGCIRLAIGIETASQRLMDELNKGTKADEALKNVLRAKAMGFQIMTFYLVGIPGETEEDVNASIEFAKKTSHFISVDELLVYPGTPLYDKYAHLVEFSLYPYKNRFKDEVFNRKASARKNRFFRSFYLRPSFMLSAPKQVFAHYSLKDAVRYVMRRSND